jgi:outer membrane protein OmpA-like peptidoglycan-associated protein
MSFRRVGLRNASSSLAGARTPLDAVRGSGKPLDSATRSLMEPRLGHDFSQVRVHDDGEAASAARAMGAQALTRGDHIIVAGAANPRLLAHELTHVVQQRNAATIEPRVSQPGEASERAADASADAVLAGPGAGPLAAPAGAIPAIQRQPAPDPPPDFQFRPSSWFQRSMGRLVIDGFPLGKATLTSTQHDQIVFQASILKTLLEGEPGGRVTVTGHGDAIGTDERNVELGNERAKAVAAVLIEASIAEASIDTDTSGKNEPATPSKGAEPRNRRAVIGFSPPLIHSPRPFLTPPTYDFAKPTPNLGLGTPFRKPDVDLGFSKVPSQTPDEPGPRRPEEPTDEWWKRSEEMMRRARAIEKNLPKDTRSPVERLGDAVVQVLDPLIKRLPVSEELQKKARDAIRDGVKAGSEKACEAGIGAVASGPEADALKAACKGIIEYKPGQSGGEQK